MQAALSRRTVARSRQSRLCCTFSDVIMFRSRAFFVSLIGAITVLKGDYQRESEIGFAAERTNEKQADETK